MIFVMRLGQKLVCLWFDDFTSLHHPTKKLAKIARVSYRVLAIGLNFFTFFFEEKINDRVDQNPMATGTVGPIKI